MARIEVGQFTRTYRQTVAEIGPLITRDRQIEISRHNLGLHPDSHNLSDYLRASERRYVTAVELLNRTHTAPLATVLDVGGFLGAFPLALARMGLRVTLAEEYHYYAGALDPLRAMLATEGVEVWDADFTGPVETEGRQFDVVSNMAMIEHLPSSPQQLMANLRDCLAADGTLVLDTPNIAYWPTRLRALRGGSVHQDYRHYFETEPPFLGHHREYTVDEVLDLMRRTGFAVDGVKLFNYSVSYREMRLIDRLMLLKDSWPIHVFRGCREVIMLAAHAA